MRKKLSSLIVMITLSLSSAAFASEWEHALNEGSPRLLFYTLVKEKPSGSLRTIRQLLNNFGMAKGDRPFRLLSRSVRLEPIGYYDININGGIPSDTIKVGPLTFKVAEESRAKSGIVLGGRLGVYGTYGLRFGETLSLGANIGIEHSFEHNFSKASLSGFGCYQKYVEHWMFADFCLSVNSRYKEQSQENTISPNVSLTKFFSSSFGSHDFKTNIGWIVHDDYNKPYVNVSSSTVFPDFGVVSLSLYLSDNVEGNHTRTWGTSIGVGTPVLGKYTKFNATHYVEEGTALFGNERKDRVFEVGVSRPVHERVNLRIAYEQRASKIAAFDDGSLSVRFDLRPWSLID